MTHPKKNTEQREEKTETKPELSRPAEINTSVYGYQKGDKDPTTYDVSDPLYGHVDGPRHKEWLAVNG